MSMERESLQDLLLKFEKTAPKSAFPCTAAFRTAVRHAAETWMQDRPAKSMALATRQAYISVANEMLSISGWIKISR